MGIEPPAGSVIHIAAHLGTMNGTRLDSFPLDYQRALAAGAESLIERTPGSLALVAEPTMAGITNPVSVPAFGYLYRDRLSLFRDHV